MVLLIIYDEYGGFYDYVFIFVFGVLNLDGIIGFDLFYFWFDWLGVRVFILFIFFWIDKGIGELFFFCVVFV